MSNEVFLSVVIPCYNEEKNIRAGVLEAVADYLKNQPYAWEVMIVDDGSSDKSPALIGEFVKVHPGFSLIKNPHQGKAATIITGMIAAKGEYVLFSDLDQATPISEMEKFLPFFKENISIVIGSRKTSRQGAPFSRLIIARGFMMLRTLILGLGHITDTQCGFKAFRRDVAQKLFKRLKLYEKRKKIEGPMVTAGFDIELLFLAKKSGYQIKEIPVSWHYVDTRRVNPIKDSWQGFWDLIKIRLNDLRGQYD